MDIQKVNTMESQNHPQPQQSQSSYTTFIRTCFNGINALSGIGILSVPYALSEGGWLSLTILFLIAFLCLYTGLLIKKCMDTSPLIKTYPDIGVHAFGQKGGFVISAFVYLELFLVAVGFLIIEGDNLHNLFPKFCLHIFGKQIGGKQTFILITAIIMLPTTWLRSLSVLAYVSFCGVLASLVLLCAIFWNGEFEGVGFREKGVLWRWNGIPTAISLYTFCFCGHAVFPTLHSSMSDKTKFRKVLLVCFILSTISYGTMAVLGYLMYGENLKSQVTLNLSKNHLSSKFAIYMILITPIAKYALLISPIAKAIEDAMILQVKGLINVVFIRTSLVVGTIIVALFVPYFGQVTAFIGAFLGITTSLLLPCICYLKINKASRRFGVELMFILVILVFGFFVAVIGTYTSLKDLINVIHKN